MKSIDLSMKVHEGAVSMCNLSGTEVGVKEKCSRTGSSIGQYCWKG